MLFPSSFYDLWASVVCSLKHTYISLWICWLYLDICSLNFSTWQGIADAHHLKKLCSMKRKKELDRKWQPKQIMSWARARELLSSKTTLPENTETEGLSGNELGENCETLCHCFGNNGWLCAQHVCECLYIISPGKCHARGWAGVGSGWVAVNPLRSPGLLCLCSLSDSQAFSLLALVTVWRSVRLAKEWLLAACL